MSKYAVWNKKDTILTPIGEVIPAEEWIKKHPVAGLDNITVICAGGEINGAFFGTLGSMVEHYTKEGCDFSTCETAEDKLAAIEAFEAAKTAEIKATVSNEELTATSLASIAASLEYQNMMSLDDIEETTTEV